MTEEDLDFPIRISPEYYWYDITLWCLAWKSAGVDQLVLVFSNTLENVRRLHIPKVAKQYSIPSASINILNILPVAASYKQIQSDLKYVPLMESLLKAKRAKSNG